MFCLGIITYITWFLFRIRNSIERGIQISIYRTTFIVKTLGLFAIVFIETNFSKTINAIKVLWNKSETPSMLLYYTVYHEGFTSRVMSKTSVRDFDFSRKFSLSRVRNYITFNRNPVRVLRTIDCHFSRTQFMSMRFRPTRFFLRRFISSNPFKNYMFSYMTSLSTPSEVL